MKLVVHREGAQNKRFRYKHIFSHFQALLKAGEFAKIRATVNFKIDFLEK